MKPAPIAIVENVTGPRHFTGVDAALRDRGGDATWMPAGEQQHCLPRGTRVLAVAEVRSFEGLNLLRQARTMGVCTVMLMDGIVEHRNTFRNPRAGARFLRPAPVDVIACAGRVDEQHLREMGNDAVATGLPRVSGIVALAMPTQPAVMVATALRPAFGDDERRRLVESLATLRGRLDTRGVEVLWRLTDGLDIELGVTADTRPLAETLASASAVITTPSSLLIEAMRAGRPTALLAPFDDPCWQRGAWMIREPELARPDRIDAVINDLLAPAAGHDRRQAEVLAELHCQDRPPAEAVAALLMELVERPRCKTRPARALDPARLPPRRAATAGRPRVVSLIRCHVSPVGGVTTWSQRMARSFAHPESGYDFRTLLVVTHPDSIAPAVEIADELTDLCVVDPIADHWQRMDTLRRAVERLEPSIVMPNYNELCYAAAMQLRGRGVPVVAVAHADDPSYRELLHDGNRWDAAVGVSDACMRWLRPRAGARPLAKIVYGVPVGAAPRAVADRGPLQLAYIGRVVEHQKRVGDLLRLIDGLESRGVAYAFHLVGDGPQLGEWRAAAGARRLVHGRITVHGARSHGWVQRFLAGIDVSVLLSDFEGTSIIMLESMGAGVVPAVTHVTSGVDEWIRDGQNGVIAPIGRPDEMAARLAELAADRDRMARMGRAAWETVRDGVAVDDMTRRYGELFDAVLARPMDHTPSDAALRVRDGSFWCKEWAEHPDQAMAWIETTLRDAGYRRIALDDPEPGCDAVILRAGGPEPVTDRARRYRARGLGVAVWPHLVESPHADRVHRVVRKAIDGGCRRIAIYGVGRHTRRVSALFQRGLPIVGFIDDDPPPWRRLFGLPIVPVHDAMTSLAPDAVVLSSDACEPRMWDRCAALRQAGVRVLPVYGTYDEPACLETGAFL